MATPTVRFNMNLTLEEDTIAKEMEKHAGSKAAVFKSGLMLMKNIKDAIKEGNQVMIVGANGQLTQLAC